MFSLIIFYTDTNDTNLYFISLVALFGNVGRRARVYAARRFARLFRKALFISKYLSQGLYMYVFACGVLLVWLLGFHSLFVVVPVWVYLQLTSFS